MSGLVRLFAELDRLGPGTAESLRWALKLAGVLPTATILDAGCGTGADLGVLLATASQGRVIAIDSSAAFIERVKARFRKVDARVCDMADPPQGPFDLIWSAGAVYSIGVSAALQAWRSRLAPNGCVAFSDLRARVSNPPPEVVAFWASEGIDLKGAESLEEEVAAAGYDVLGARWVGPAGWASYYGPLESELDRADADPDVVSVMRDEIALWRTHGVSYGYRIVVARPI